eukprot:gene5428-8893_t
MQRQGDNGFLTIPAIILEQQFDTKIASSIENLGHT